MGWHVSGSGALQIAAERQVEAHMALRLLAADNRLLGATRPHALLGAPNLVACLIRAGFVVSVEGDAITGLEFCPEPLGEEHLMAGSLDQTVLLAALAPFIEPGGAMAFVNEAGDEWVHLFRAGGMASLEASA